MATDLRGLIIILIFLFTVLHFFLGLFISKKLTIISNDIIKVTCSLLLSFILDILLFFITKYSTNLFVMLSDSQIRAEILSIPECISNNFIILLIKTIIGLLMVADASFYIICYSTIKYEYGIKPMNIVITLILNIVSSFLLLLILYANKYYEIAQTIN